MKELNFSLGKDDLKDFKDIFVTLHESYWNNFKTKTRDASKHALQYLQGQLLERKRANMTNMEKIVPGSDHQSLQHFISVSPWDDEGVIEHIQSDVSRLIGDEKKGSIHIDESAFIKKGKSSVGVARQYCGRLGKVDNCQVGVFLGYAKNNYRTLIDKRLYLPKEWIDDTERREKCGVPYNITFNTKAELALKMLLDAKKRKVPFGWVGMDSHYGEQPLLLDRISAENMVYIADIPCDTRVWMKESVEQYGEDASLPKPDEVRHLENKLPASLWNRVLIRDTDRKELWSQIACIRVYPVRDGLPGKEHWLIIRKDEGENKTKHQMSNAPANTPIKSLGEMSASRYWIERAIQDAKGEGGMTDYEVRGWLGWHHHMTMTFLAMLFLLMVALDMKHKAPMLTVQDVREILEVIMPKKELDEDELLDMIKQKHKRRLSAMRSHHKRNRK